MGCSIQILLLLVMALGIVKPIHARHFTLTKDVGGDQSQPSSTGVARVNSTHPVRHGQGHLQWRGMRCPTNTLEVFQSRVDPLPGGWPQHFVQICNICATNCTAYDIHLSCGWFASAKLINPRDFRRLRFNDCLVKDGKELEAGICLSFTYAETYPYPLAVSSIKCK
ncbi:hypothetical protein MKW92_020712 [Papaver armeniacum]|nr:hypothetical protein MKW92_020712 [Papaver armeniacum]